MHHLRVAEQALRVVAEPATQRYVCRLCLAHAARQLHTTTPRRAAEIPFLKRMANKLFGDKKEEEKKAKQKEKGLARAAEEGTAANKPGIPEHLRINKVTYRPAKRYDPTTDKDYLPSTTWHGLERVGGEQWAKRRLDMGEQYTGFLPQKKVELTNIVWQRLLHNIAVEIAVLNQAGRSAMEVCNVHPKGSSVKRTAKASVSQRPDGTLRVRFSHPSDEAAVLAGIEPTRPHTVSKKGKQKEQIEVAEVTPESLALQLMQIRQSRVEVNWVDVRFLDPETKLAFIKRTMQLSGKRIPDIQMNSAQSLNDLYEAFKTRDKPKKLAQAPQVQELASTLPNVTVHKWRRTPIHKEKQIGRWKIIEEELLKRDLPVTGSRWQNAKEGLRLYEK
ncbi:hypothetical protein CERZMDRAFT_99682 [Cercospora zeae-maydis SCOH1-5]|uniref:Large ribosomal subunit protein mL50 n=1 Tax=Cercospora zeae-maydis SCOH1-5 TaxID=717836 RepID=A0A6A6FAA2_9PEZI|nr:hypothetical protein CERZMDRAFT_99682 [Cercospora zeae-maydis SCOH1-5]